MVHCLRLHASNAGNIGSIPSQGTKVPHACGVAKKFKNKTKQNKQHLVNILCTVNVTSFLTCWLCNSTQHSIFSDDSISENTMQQISPCLSAQERHMQILLFQCFLFVHLIFTNHFTDFFFSQVLYRKDED